jgi:hypothetical protein
MNDNKTKRYVSTADRLAAYERRKSRQAAKTNERLEKLKVKCSHILK